MPRASHDSQTMHIGRLVVEYRQGRIEALEEIFNRAYERMRQIARDRLHSGGKLAIHEETGDLLHYAWITRIQKSLDRSHVVIPSTRDFLNLCAKWMRETLIDLERRYNARPSGPGAGSWEFIDDRDSPKIRSQREDLYDALEKLPSREQEVVNFLVFHNMTIAEAADVIGCDPSTVKRRYNRAKYSLGKLLKEENA